MTYTPKITWSYDYSPYFTREGEEIPAFEIFDADGNKLFDTNEDSPCAEQEANAALAAAAPILRAALAECLRLLADFDENDGEEGDAYRNALAALQLINPTKGTQS